MEINRLTITGTELRQSPSPHIVYRIEVVCPLRVWTCYRRFSDFQRLHQQWTDRWHIRPVPASLPSKTFLSSSGMKPEITERRRLQLNEYLNTLLTHPDSRWRQSEEWREFLAVPPTATNKRHDDKRPESSDGVSRPSTETSAREKWMNELRGLQSLAQEIRSLLFYRNRTQNKDIIIADDTTMQLKKSIASLSYRLKLLGTALEDQSLELAEGELMRRQDLLQTLRSERDKFQRSVSDINNNPGVNSFTSSASSSAFASPATRRRVFGIDALVRETEQTKPLDNEGILQLQQNILGDQDQHMDGLVEVVQRQKEVGLAIGQELEVQNQMLSQLDDKVDLTAARIRNANRMANKLT